MSGDVLKSLQNLTDKPKASTTAMEVESEERFEMIVPDLTLINGEMRPKDWPASKGEIDLAVQDLPHDSADTEWWYANGHFKTEAGKEYSFFCSFFRMVLCWDEEKGAMQHVHALNWALVDPDNKVYHFDPVLSKNAPAVVKAQIEAGSSKLDPRLEEAFLEVLNKGKVPLPDRLFEGDVTVCKDKLDIDFSGNTFVKTLEGNYKVHCESPALGIALDVELKPQRKAIRQGHNGIVKIGLNGDEMFYYFIPRNELTGTVTIKGKEEKISGRGWYDHEFGGRPRHRDPKSAEKEVFAPKLEYGWNWLSLQLSNGTDITANTVFSPSEGMKVLDKFAIVVQPDGTRHEVGCEFKPLNSWISVRTTTDFPTQWLLTIPDLKIEIEIEAAFPNQEFMTLISKPSFWEGRVHAKGVCGGDQVTGLGFIERHGFGDMSSLDKFFKRISKLVRMEIDKVIPLEADYEKVRDLVADEKNDHLMKGLDTQTYIDTICRPIREIVDRGGKAWRSFALLLVLDAVGGNSFEYQHWLSMPEIMHVGSLIVDDIQDESETRRGGPCCHKIYGDAIAINAGTAAYFIALDILQKKSPNMTQATRIQIYEQYFLTLRAGHAGQAFDIKGLEYMMDDAIATGECDKLVNAVICTHRLKSAVPAGTLARMGSIVGGGSNVQTEALAAYFEAIGIAFQVIDDVLNLRGLPGKVKGEDLMAGKITYPVALAMNKSKLAQKKRADLWNVIQSKPQDPKVVDALVEIIEDCGALPEAEQHAKDMVEAAWKKLDPVVPDSFYKLNIRAFGSYVLSRHY